VLLPKHQSRARHVLHDMEKLPQAWHHQTHFTKHLNMSTCNTQDFARSKSIVNIPKTASATVTSLWGWARANRGTGRIGKTRKHIVKNENVVITIAQSRADGGEKHGMESSSSSPLSASEAGTARGEGQWSGTCRQGIGTSSPLTRSEEPKEQGTWGLQKGVLRQQLGGIRGRTHEDRGGRGT
jgi:hypothetical protein